MFSALSDFDLHLFWLFTVSKNCSIVCSDSGELSFIFRSNFWVLSKKKKEEKFVYKENKNIHNKLAKLYNDFLFLLTTLTIHKLSDTGCAPKSKIIIDTILDHTATNSIATPVSNMGIRRWRIIYQIVAVIIICVNFIIVIVCDRGGCGCRCVIS